MGKCLAACLKGSVEGENRSPETHFPGLLAPSPRQVGCRATFFNGLLAGWAV
jgi:hypothetical protein